MNAVWITPSAADAALRKHVEVVERAAEHFRAGRGECRGLVIGTGEARHAMAGADQLLDHGRADPAGGTGYEYAHVLSLQDCSGTVVSASFMRVK